MRYDAVLFDLDGTLLDTNNGICESFRHAFHRMDYPPVDDSALTRCIGAPLLQIFRDSFHMNEEAAAEAAAIFRSHYTESGMYQSVVYPGIPNLLRALKDEGMYLAVATVKTLPAARRILEHFGLLKYFDAVVAPNGERVNSSKADLITAALPAHYTRAAMVGDTHYDMEAARLCRIDAIGAAWGFGGAEELEHSGADVIAAHTRELQEILCGKLSVPEQGFFISIEGLDGSGKTTQMNAIKSYLIQRGYEVVTTREPGGNVMAEQIRSLILDPQNAMEPLTEAYLYAAARAEHVRRVIRPALNRGKVVLCDRFVDSSIAYQGGGRELGTDLIAAINAPALEGTLPDLTLLYMVDAQTAFLRRSRATELDRLERSGEAFFRRVYNAYAQLAAANPKRICAIDGGQSIEEVRRRSCAAIERLLAAR